MNDLTQGREAAPAELLANVVEIVMFRPLPGIDDEEILAAADRMTAVLRGMRGFITRDLAISSDGRWLDLVRWRDPASAQRAARATLAMDVCREYSATMDPSHREFVRLSTLPCERGDTEAAPHEIATQRLSLEQVSERDIEDVQALWERGGPAHCAANGALPRWPAVREAIGISMLRVLPRRYDLWGARLHGRQELVAFGGFWFNDQSARFELLLVTDPRMTRRGIATEFGRALLDWAWGPLELDEVGACVDAAREDYPRVLQKLGFWHTEDQVRDGTRVAVYRTPRPKV